MSRGCNYLLTSVFLISLPNGSQHHYWSTDNGTEFMISYSKTDFYGNQFPLHFGSRLPVRQNSISEGSPIDNRITSINVAKTRNRKTFHRARPHLFS